MIKTPAFLLEKTKDFLILDQSLLPDKKEFVKIKNPEDMTKAIKKLQVRGANLIGISAGFALAQYALTNPAQEDLNFWAKKLSKARPTARHLSLAVDRIMSKKNPEDKWLEAVKIFEEDQKLCEKLAQNGKDLISSKENILTYCNTGSLATGGIGTALGVIRQAFYDKKNIHVYVPETRPLDQGSRLTFWELSEEKIPCTLLCDNMLAELISNQKIGKAFVGADRISQNGDTANKIGTYSLAILCHHFQIPFYVVAPSSTIDKSLPTGESIKIEQRNPLEVSNYWGGKEASIRNPAFDVTPRKLITGIITEKGIL